MTKQPKSRWSIVNGRRGAFQVLFATVYTLVSVSYLLVPPSPGRSSALSWLPGAHVHYLGFIWAVVAVVGFVGATLPRPRDRFSFIGLTLAPTIWGFLYLIGWMLGTSKTGWVTTCLYWAIAGAVMVVSGMQGPSDRDERMAR
ncbi:hypothetical protein MB46_10435 [Arthrobacter alpinus]|uniref:hypothetical protein n=1 Tax=Arthrobacter alpinus TaxID=656366 RepID=UPI0005C846D2|nr:hypothetical protein [Arthrobacter alpinus]ALV45838.1 hypothetical protein MB46_10435 [Arthrobacter alpinus]